MTVKEKLIDLLTDNLPRCGNLPHWDNPLQLSCDEQVERIADHLIANGVTVQEWISVKDRLPEEDGNYLVCHWFMKTPIISLCGFAKDGEEVDEYDLKWQKNVWYDYCSEYGYVAINDITHWMPLPQPPKL